MLVEAGQQYETRDGRPVKILTTECERGYQDMRVLGHKQVLGLVLTPDGDDKTERWRLAGWWKKNGRYLSWDDERSIEKDDPMDLVLV